MKVILIVCILILQIKYSFADNYYENYSLYDVTAYNDRDRAMLYGLHLVEEELIFMNLVTNQAAIPMKVIVKNTHLAAFEESIADTNIEYDYDPEYLKQYDSQEVFSKSLNPNENFLTYGQIVNWGQKKIKEYPNFLHYREVLTQTYEKREMFVIKVSPSRKPCAVYIVGGDVGRDWMSSAIVLNFLNRLLNRFDKVKYNKKRPMNELFDLYDFYIVPVMNPDGYAYSTEKNIKFWMANRQRLNKKKLCRLKRDLIGVNLDRNWHLTKFVGSENECNQIFLGHSALSELECIGLFSRLNKNAAKLIAFIHVRGCGRLITTPTATGEKTVNHDLMKEFLPSVCHNLQVTFNESYLCGTTSTYFYNFTSNMADYVKKKLNIPMVLTVSMQHEDNFLPTRGDISILTDHFMLILNDTLMFAKEFYGPLFNSQMRHYSYKKYLKFILLSFCNILF